MSHKAAIDNNCALGAYMKYKPRTLKIIGCLVSFLVERVHTSMLLNIRERLRVQGSLKKQRKDRCQF